MVFTELLSQWVGSWVRISMRGETEPYIVKLTRVGEDCLLGTSTKRTIPRTPRKQMADRGAYTKSDIEAALLECQCETLFPRDRVLRVERIDRDQEREDEHGR
jgi:hypothetical protein